MDIVRKGDIVNVVVIPAIVAKRIIELYYNVSPLGSVSLTSD